MRVPARRRLRATSNVAGWMSPSSACCSRPRASACSTRSARSSRPPTSCASSRDCVPRGTPGDLVAAVLGQARLRAKARAKFGDFAGRMLFTPDGLEQATRLQRRRRCTPAASRAPGSTWSPTWAAASAPMRWRWPLSTSGVLAVERDEATAAIASFNLAPFAAARVELGDADHHRPHRRRRRLARSGPARGRAAARQPGRLVPGSRLGVRPRRDPADRDQARARARPRRCFPRRGTLGGAVGLGRRGGRRTRALVGRAGATGGRARGAGAALRVGRRADGSAATARTPRWARSASTCSNRMARSSGPA